MINIFGNHSDNNNLQIKQSHLGAQVLDIQMPVIKDLLFLSDIQLKNKPFRGGVPVLFPQFNNFGRLKKHGFVRDMNWDIIERQTSNCLSTRASLTVDSQASFDVVTDWGNECCLTLDTAVSDSQVVFNLTVHNTGATAFEFTGGLHPYFYLHDADSMQVLGLKNIEFQNFSKGDSFSDLVVNGSHIERLYDRSEALGFFNGKDRFQLSCAGFNQWMIWNPGADNAQSIEDLRDSDWKNFICIEPVIVDNPIYLEVDENFVASMRIEKTTEQAIAKSRL